MVSLLKFHRRNEIKTETAKRTVTLWADRTKVRMLLTRRNHFPFDSQNVCPALIVCHS